MKWLILFVLTQLGLLADDKPATQAFCQELAVWTDHKLTCDDVYEWLGEKGLSPDDAKAGISNGF